MCYSAIQATSSAGRICSGNTASVDFCEKQSDDLNADAFEGVAHRSKWRVASFPSE